VHFNSPTILALVVSKLMVQLTYYWHCMALTFWHQLHFLVVHDISVYSAAAVTV